MKAMLLHKVVDLASNSSPLKLSEVPIPVCDENELLIRVSCCGVCHTELDEIEGRTPPPQFPVIPGHQVVGIVENTGAKVTKFKKGARVGVAWIYSACGICEFCQNGVENLCKNFLATGRDRNGGYAEFMTINENFAYRIPEIFSDSEAAPLLCAGAIGYRSLMLTKIKNGENIGFTGFGASAHLVLMLVKNLFPKSQIFVFARSQTEREFAKELGAVWAGDSEDHSPEKLSAIIDTTPAWKPVVEALKNLKLGGRLVINAIRKEEKDKEYLLKLNYPEHLWSEKEIKSVANVTRKDVEEFLNIAASIPIKPELEEYKLEDANKALIELKSKRVRGAKVLKNF